MFENLQDAKSAVTGSASVLRELIDLYDHHGLSIAAAHLSTALDAACSEAGVDRAMLSAQFVSSTDE